jgi:hypothetical protein
MSLMARRTADTLLLRIYHKGVLRIAASFARAALGYLSPVRRYLRENRRMIG